MGGQGWSLEEVPTPRRAPALARMRWWSKRIGGQVEGKAEKGELHAPDAPNAKAGSDIPHHSNSYK